MNFPPPLTREELIAIRDGNRRNADIRQLLHEIRRLRALILKTRHYFRLADTGYDHADQMRESLLAQILQEPCIQEDEAERTQWREELRKARR